MKQIMIIYKYFLKFYKKKTTVLYYIVAIYLYNLLSLSLSLSLYYLVCCYKIKCNVYIPTGYRSTDKVQ
jgi:hypothetical protein